MEKKVEVTLEGTSPLLQNRNLEGELTKVRHRNESSKDSPELSEVLKKTYHFDNNIIYQPAEHIIRMLQTAGSQIKRGKMGNFRKMMGAGFVMVEPDGIPHKHQGVTVDARTVVIKATKGRIMRYRPKLPKWGLDFTCIVDVDTISIEVLKECFEIAGKYVGLGDFRPENGGMFGRFIVTKFKEVA